MLCGCTGMSAAAARSSADETYSKDDSGVYTGGEDNMSLIKVPAAHGAHRKPISSRGGSFLKSDQTYPGCFAWNKGLGRRSMDDLDMYGAQSPVILQAAAERSSLSDLRRAPSIPIMEVHDPACGVHLQSQENLAWASRMYQPYKGQFKLAVYINCGLLTVHVKEARQLSSSYGTECNTFVKLSLSPDETKRTKCRTSVVPETDKPSFDEKFSFELLDGDMKKRLLISLWHKQNTHSHSELLGCMSFGIRHIVQKKSEVDGWYFLLSDAVGKRKHLQVGSQHLQKVGHSTTLTSEEESEQTADSSNKLVLSDSSHDNMAERFGVTLSKGASGFGFQVSGERPAFILKLQEDSISAQAGLLPGDNIIKIDDHDVSNLSSDTVARILKQCQGLVKLGILRNKKAPDLLQDVRPLQHNQETLLPMNSKEFIPSALPNKFKFDGMVKPTSNSRISQTKPMPPGSPVKERRAMMTSGSPISGRKQLKPSGSPVVERRPLNPSGSPIVDRRSFKQSESPGVVRRSFENGDRHDIVVVSASPVSGRKHSKRLQDYTAHGNSNYESITNGLSGPPRGQRTGSPHRSKRYGGGGSPSARRRDVVNVSEELRNGQRGGVVRTPARTNGFVHGNVENYVHNLAVGNTECLTNSRGAYEGVHGDTEQYQNHQMPQGQPVHAQDGYIPDNRQTTAYHKDNGYLESSRLPNGSANTAANFSTNNSQYGQTNSFTENGVPSHPLLTHDNLPSNHSGIAYVHNPGGDNAIHRGQFQHAVNNGDFRDRQKGRIPTCDDSSSEEDEEFYVHSRTPAGVNIHSMDVHHQTVSATFQNNHYKVSSF